MPQSLANVLIHLIFSTKNRVPLIHPGVEDELFRYLATACRSCGCPAPKVGGTDDLRHFAWQNGYGAFSIGQSQLSSVRAYIARQREHHRRATFQEEYRRFLEKYGIRYDERYVWD